MSKLLLNGGVQEGVTVTGESSSSKLRKLLDTFCTKLSKKGFDILRSFCEHNGFCSEGHAAHLLGILVDYNIVNQDNLQLLTFIAKACGQKEILVDVEGFTRSLPALTESPQAMRQFSDGMCT
jgi:hypothetical protein